jgi:hypothetical protein
MMNALTITMSGEAFKHKFYHYRLVYSGWTSVRLKGEGFNLARRK